MHKIRTVVWNCRRIKNKKNELTRRIVDYDITILTETKSSRPGSIYFTGYRTISKESKENSGGIAIIVRKEIEFETINSWYNIGDNIDILGIRITNPKEKFNVIAVYRRPKLTINRKQWEKILKFDDKGLKTILTGDFNAHNIAWNCRDTATNGDNLFEVTNNVEMVCLNQETEYRLGSIGQTSSNIDLIFSTDKLADKIDIKQSEDTWGSDHFPIEVIINQEIHVYRKRTNRISTKKTIWEEYPKMVLKKI